MFKIIAKGHENVLALHKSTFEFTTDKELTPAGDCIIGVNSNKIMADIPESFKNKLKNSNTKILLSLDTPNNHDEIIGYGHENLILDHPSDMVCRKSDYICSRTLMINSNKAARDIDRTLIEDLKNGENLEITINFIYDG